MKFILFIARPTGQENLQTQSYQPTAQTQTQNYQPTQIQNPPQDTTQQIREAAQSQSGREDRMEIIDETDQVYGGRTRQQEQAEASQRQQQQQQAPGPQLGNLGGGGNVFGQMLGQMSSMVIYHEKFSKFF